MTSLHNLSWLIRREHWERRRLVSAPLWLALLLGVVHLLLLTALWLRGGADWRHGPTFRVTVNTGHDSVLQTLSLQSLGSANIHDISHTLSTLGMATLLLFALAFGAALISYGLSCLYDERRDRSVLFWKSLPVGDGETVAAKLIFGLVIMSLAWSVGALIALWLSIGVFSLPMLASGVAAAELFAHTHLVATTVLLLGALPVYMLTLAPAMAWLVLCSVVGGRQRALVAIIIPMLLALTNALSMTSSLWHLLIARLVPIGFVRALDQVASTGDYMRGLAYLWQPVVHAGLWWGGLTALVMSVAAAWYRARYTVLV